jgi:Ca2+/H+ antiporter, TMEM165/GDT1 family
MNPLIPAFLAALLTELGGATQQIAAREKGNTKIIVLIAALALATMTAAGVVGGVVAPMLTWRASSLMVGGALALTGITMAIFRQHPSPDERTAPALIKAQLASYGSFIVFALTALTNQPILAVAGGFCGVMAATVPAFVLGGKHAVMRQMPLARRMAGGMLAAVGLWAASGAI